MMNLISTNPADNYQPVGDVKISSEPEVKEKVKKAHAARTAWKELGVKKRIELLKSVREEFKKRQEEIAQLITKEMGKPINQASGDVKGNVDEFKWFLDNVEPATRDEITFEDKDFISKIIYEPYGVVGVITPWNYPFGGYKQSGIGREHGVLGFRELCQVKVISASK